MGRHSLETPGRKKKDPATSGVGILNVVSGDLNDANATAKFGYQPMVDLFSLLSVDYCYEAKRRHQEIESGSQAARS